MRVKLSLRDSERVVEAPTSTGTPKKCKALFGEPLQREPPKSVKHFSGNPYGQDLIVDGSSRKSTPTIKWRLYVLYLAPAVLFYRSYKKRAIRESPLRNLLPFNKRTVEDAGPYN